jgi:hypothetical protein
MSSLVASMHTMLTFNAHTHTAFRLSYFRQKLQTPRPVPITATVKNLIGSSFVVPPRRKLSLAHWTRASEATRVSTFVVQLLAKVFSIEHAESPSSKPGRVRPSASSDGAGDIGARSDPGSLRETAAIASMTARGQDQMRVERAAMGPEALVP